MLPSAESLLPPALAGWLPAAAVAEHRKIAMPAPGESTLQERAQVAKAVAKRQREFLTGRAAARAALARLGVSADEVPIAANRTPIWPPGVVGSITHSASECLVAVARRADLRALGLDVEPAEPLEPELWPRICTAVELKWLHGLPAAAQGLWAKHFFCAKEALYKGQFPEFAVPLGFHDLVLRLDAGSQEFSARLAGASVCTELEPARRRELADFLENARGSWRLCQGSLFHCAAWLH